MTVPRSLLGRAATTLLGLLAAAATLLAVHVPGSNGAYVAKIANPTNNTATAAYFTCGGLLSSPTFPHPTFFYALNDLALVAADTSGNVNNGSYSTTGVTNRSPDTGACVRDQTTGVTLNGTSGAISGPALPVTAPNTFTEEIWFRTTTTTGGKLIGFGRLLTGQSNQYDRHLYLDNSGRVIFGVNPDGSVPVVVSPKSYNDGQWHFAAATLSSAGMYLYVDGAQVGTPNTSVTYGESFSGYWRIGYDNLNGWPAAPTSYFYKGDLADAEAFNGTALTAAQIAQQYVAGH